MKIKISLLLTILITIAANAQERPARTWAGADLTISKSTVGNTATGFQVDLAYDLRHGFQARARGEYRDRAAIPNLFTGDGDLQGRSEIRYSGALVYHFKREGTIRPFTAGGVEATRHFFEVTGRPAGHLYGRALSLYNSSVNPTLMIGAGIGRNSEISYTKYFADTYSYSNLRGHGFDFSNTRRVSGRLHLRTGVRVRVWTFREGAERYDERAGEVSGFVGFRFQ